MSKKVLIQLRDLRVGNGIAACIMSYFPYLIKKGYYVDFLLNRNIKSQYSNLVESSNCNIFILPNDTGKPNIKNTLYIAHVLSSNKYDILHINISGLNAVLTSFFGFIKKVKCRIYHAHNPRENSSFKAYCRSLIYENLTILFANKYAACSEFAGNSIFKKKHFIHIRNVFDTAIYLFDSDFRNNFRKKYNLENTFIIGTVGRLAEQKNPFFTISIFRKVVQLLPSAKLLLIGDGPLRDKILTEIKKQKLDSSVIYLGCRTDVNKLYSVMDAFLLPSHFEGLGIVFCEAQISGLPCFGSYNVPKDTEISNLMHRLSLKDSPMVWAQQIVKSKRSFDVDPQFRFDFDIQTAQAEIINLYS